MPTFPRGDHASLPARHIDYRERVDKARALAQQAEPARPDRKKVIGQHTPADKQTLRGIPVVGGITGTIHGTDPLLALLANEAMRERQAA